MFLSVFLMIFYLQLPNTTFSWDFSPVKSLLCFSGHNFVNRILFSRINSSMVTPSHVSTCHLSQCYSSLYITESESGHEFSLRRSDSNWVPVVTCHSSSPNSPCTCRGHLFPSLIGQLISKLSPHWLNAAHTRSWRLSESGSGPGSTGSFGERKQDIKHKQKLCFFKF